jgi:calpain-7
VNDFIQILGREPSQNKRDIVDREVRSMIAKCKSLKDTIAQSQKGNILAGLPDLPPFQVPAAVATPAAEPTVQASSSNVADANGQSGPDVSPDTADELLRLAQTAEDRSDATGAVKLYRQALDILLRVLEGLKAQGVAAEDWAFSSIDRRAHDILDRIKYIKSAKEAASGRLTTEEKKVLALTSTINGITCLPFLDHDLLERFRFPSLFTDPDGNPKLSQVQMGRFAAWKRPHEFIKNPRMIDLISPYSIKQTIITDCSFVSSITVSAYYERKFGKSLITSCIYPQDSKGKPVYNPCGKYMVLLMLNGVKRKVIVDDFLPVDSSNNLLCSFSNNRSELWVSIVEKAFLKVMGGYDFPGSNGGTDLYTLTGWIPERISTKSEKDFEKDRTWQRLLNAQRFGDCLITCSTGDMTEEYGDQVGLVPTHAYAVLRTEEVGKLRLLLIKNPWSRKRWNGKFSPEDSKSWTPALRKHLKYDAQTASEFDNGVFWIDYDSLCKEFSTIYMSWNPDLFKYSTSMHGLWPKSVGPKVDRYNLEFDPQYQLVVTSRPDPQQPTAVSQPVWILLSKHEVEKKEFDDQYIALHMYDGKGNDRIYYPENALSKGTYINNQHFLVRIDVPHGTAEYKVVISQYEKMYDLAYTLGVYSPAKFTLQPVPHRFIYTSAMTGSWTDATAGGSPNNRLTYLNNPQFSITLPQRTALRLKLEAPPDFSINIRIFAVRQKSSGSATEFDQGGHRIRSMFSQGDVDVKEVADTGAYRKGYCYAMLEEEDLENLGLSFPVKLTAIISTFRPQQLASFRFTALTTKCNPTVTAL